jgi:hypothetical protein
LGSITRLVAARLPARPVTSAELQAQLKPVALDLAIVRRSVEQLASNQDQLARKEDQEHSGLRIVPALRRKTDAAILWNIFSVRWMSDALALLVG